MTFTYFLISALAAAFDEVLNHILFNTHPFIYPRFRCTRSSEFAIEEEHLRRIEKQLDNSPVLCRELVQPVEPLAIICHGDFLRNNIAYKYQDAENVSGILQNVHMQLFTVVQGQILGFPLQ